MTTYSILLVIQLYFLEWLQSTNDPVGDDSLTLDISAIQMRWFGLVGQANSSIFRSNGVLHLALVLGQIAPFDFLDDQNGRIVMIFHQIFDSWVIVVLMSNDLGGIETSDAVLVPTDAGVRRGFVMAIEFSIVTLFRVDDCSMSGHNWSI